MEQPMKQNSLALIVCLVGEHVPRHGEPPQPAPGDSAVSYTRKAGGRPLRLRLACGMGSGRLIKDHQRTPERHTPQLARVSLAELLDFFEPSLGELRLDLCFRNCGGAKQRKQ